MKKQKEDNSKEVQIRKDIKYDYIKNLVRASFLAGQIEGLKHNTLTNPESIRQREFLVDLILSDHLLN
jgi:hypothetical protein